MEERSSRERARRGPVASVATALMASVLAVGPTALAQEAPEPPPLPEAPPNSTLVDDFNVGAASATGTDSTSPLVAGQTYVVEASGVVGFGGGALADSECANFPSAPTFKRELFPSTPHTADLLVDRSGIEWVATTPDAENCNTTDHVYRTFLVPEATKRFNFVFNDTGYRGDNSGQLRVRIFLTDQVAPAGTLINQFSFAAANPNGAATGAVLSTTRSYRVQVSGTYTVGQAANSHDAECTQTSGLPGQRQDGLDDVSGTVEVLVDGGEVDWVPTRGRTGCDDRNHVYIFEMNGAGGPANLRVRDSWYGDNTGLLTVRVFELGPASQTSGEPGPALPTVPGTEETVNAARNGVVFVEELTVDSRSDHGADTATALMPGQIYVFEASGRVRFGNGDADAECAAFDLVPTFKREYFPDAPNTADLWVDGVGREWSASVPDAEGCNTTNHTYTFFFVPQTPKRVNLVFRDGGWRGDNSGQFSVRVFLTDKVPPAGTEIDHFGFAADDADGATSSASLAPNRSYRVQASGVYQYGQTGSISDPECVQSPSGAPGQRQDVFDDAGSTPDVLFRLQEVDWVPMQGRTGCDDRTHAYMLEVSGIGGPVNLRIRDGWHGDNSGLVEVRIFELGPASTGSSGSLPFEPPGGDASPPEPSAERVLVSQTAVDSRSAAGSDTPAALAAGQTYLVEASGLVSFGVGRADAECANFETNPVYKREWFPSAPHTADLVVDGVGVEWTPVTSDAEGCDTDNHAYSLFLVPETTKRYNFRFNEDGGRSDNSGQFIVRVFLVDTVRPAGAQVDGFVLSAADSDGASTGLALSPSTSYRLQVSGTFTVNGTVTSYDAECASTAGTPGDRQEAFDAAGSSPDVVVNGVEASWVPVRGRTGCDDSGHTYILEVSGISGPVNLKVRDTWYGDNVGQLDVKVFELS